VGPILGKVDKAFEPNFNIWSNVYNYALTKALKTGFTKPSSNTFESSLEKSLDTWPKLLWTFRIDEPLMN